MIYEKFELVSNDNPHLYQEVSPIWTPSLADLAALSQGAWMKPLTVEGIKTHVLGASVVGTWYEKPFADHQAVLSYAGITGYENCLGLNCAVIGGVIVHPTAREMGLGTLTVDWVVKKASTPMLQAQMSHEGYLARCNEFSAGLFKRLGFTTVGTEHQPSGQKTVMIKPLWELWE